MVTSPQVVHKYYVTDGHKFVLDEGALKQFQETTESNIRAIEDKCTNTLGMNQASHEVKIGQLERSLENHKFMLRALEKDIELASGFLHHIGILHPEWVESYRATKEVSERLDSANEIREVQESAF